MTEPTEHVSAPSAPESSLPLSAPAPSAPAPRAAWRQPAVVVAAAAVALLGWQWAETRVRLQDMQEELAKRLSAGDANASEIRGIAKQSQEGLRVVQERIGAMDARIDQMQGQQGALDALYQELARTRDDRLLAEVEQAITIANQQLQLAGNVEAALLALQSADGALSRVDRAHFVPLRKAVNRDIERLKALPAVDVTGMTLKIEGLMAGVDSLPLAFERKPLLPVVRQESGASGVLAGVFADIWREIRQLIRIERLDRPDPGLLSPTQVVFLRENLKLRLLDARLALLQRDGRVFKEDISQAQAWVGKYFDGTAAVTQAALDTLAQLGEARLVVELPVLTESLAAIKGVKVVPERLANPMGGR